MKRIKIFDTTLRDGEQSPGCSMNLAEKIEMAKQLEKLGAQCVVEDIPVLDVGAAQTMVHGPNFYQRFICSTNMSIGETYWWTLQRKLESQIQKNI